MAQPPPFFRPERSRSSQRPPHGDGKQRTERFPISILAATAEFSRARRVRSPRRWGESITGSVLASVHLVRLYNLDAALPSPLPKRYSMHAPIPLIWAEAIAYRAHPTRPLRKPYLDEVGQTRGAWVAELLRRAAMAFSERESA